MDLSVIVNGILNYGSVVMALVLALVTAVTMAVEVLKRLLPRVPTDLVVFATAQTLTALTVLVTAEVLTIPLRWYFIPGSIMLGIAVAYAAMFGWDKFTALISRLKTHLSAKERAQCRHHGTTCRVSRRDASPEASGRHCRLTFRGPQGGQPIRAKAGVCRYALTPLGIVPFSHKT